MPTTWACRLKFYSVGAVCLVAATISTGQDFGINIGRTWTGHQSLRVPVGLRVYIGRNYRNSQGRLHLRLGYEWS